MRIITICTLIMVLFFISSCSGFINSSANTKVMSTSTPSKVPSTLLPSITYTPAATTTLFHETSLPKTTGPVAYPVSPTPTMVNPLTPIVNERMKIQCLDILPALPTDLASKGILVLDNDNGAETYLVDMAASTKFKLSEPATNLEFFANSPDRKFIAYDELHLDSTVNIIVADSRGIKRYKIPKEDHWGTITAWLDNQRLVINLPTESDEHGRLINPSKVWSLLVLNPYTGESHVLDPDFPDIYDFPPLPHWAGWEGTVYDPTLSRVVFLQGKNTASNPVYYALWDIKSRQILANLGPSVDLDAIPRWSLSGEFLALAMNLNKPQKWPVYDMFIVSRDGQVSQLTFLSDYIPWVYIDDLSWSPDGSLIAFWFEDWPINKPNSTLMYGRHLAVVNIANNDVTDYCIPGDYSTYFGIRRVPPPMWSPDGKQLVVQNRYSEEHSRVILIDLERNLAAQIAEDMEPVGWMVK